MEKGSYGEQSCYGETSYDKMSSRQNGIDANLAYGEKSSRRTFRDRFSYNEELFESQATALLTLTGHLSM